MKVKKEKILDSILRESPIYSELEDDERRILIENLIKVYPCLLKERHEDIEAG